MKKILASAGLVLALAGCGGGAAKVAASSPPPSPTASTITDPNGVTCVALDGSGYCPGDDPSTQQPNIPAAPAPSSTAPQTVTFIVYGTPGANVTYGAAGSDSNGTVPMTITENIPANPPAFYALTAQLQGSGTVSVIIKIDGQQLSSGVANGGYNIASAEVGQNPITGQWEDDN